MDSQPESLQAATEQYLRSTPGLKYPQTLINAFPRIANHVVRLKDDPNGLRTYFDTLINDLRGNRKGFPFEVLMDVDDLRIFMLTKHSGAAANTDPYKWY